MTTKRQPYNAAGQLTPARDLGVCASADTIFSGLTLTYTPRRAVSSLVRRLRRLRDGWADQVDAGLVDRADDPRAIGDWPRRHVDRSRGARVEQPWAVHSGWDQRRVACGRLGRSPRLLRVLERHHITFILDCCSSSDRTTTSQLPSSSAAGAGLWRSSTRRPAHTRVYPLVTKHEGRSTRPSGSRRTSPTMTPAGPTDIHSSKRFAFADWR